MSEWLKGTIRAFVGGKKPDLRKVQTRPHQPFAEQHFFHVDGARQAGYTDKQLAPGQTIEFRADPDSPLPRVQEFKPPPTAAPRVGPPPPVVTGVQGRGGSSRRASTGTRPGRAALPRRDNAHVAASGEPFLNPYHFVPIAPPGRKWPRKWPVGDTLADDDGATHDRFLSREQGYFSGRVLCRVEAEGPVVVGAGRTRPDGEDASHRVEPFRLPNPETGAMEPAIPGSSLRGLVSSIAEAASGSTLRVLHDRRDAIESGMSYGRRADYQKEALSAIGMIRKAKDGHYELQPLTLSMEEMQRRPSLTQCRAYLNGYRYRGQVAVVEGTFLASSRESYSSSNEADWWYARMAPQHADWHRSRSGQVIGVDLRSDPIPEAQWKGLDEPEQRLYTRGVLLILGLGGRKAADLPPTKKHELFVPCPDPPAGPPLPIPKPVMDEFRALLDHAREIDRGGAGGSKDEYPFVHEGRDRKDPEPRDGDLVYYEADHTCAVRRLSYTAIWRRPVPGTLYGSFASVDEDLVPFGRRHSRGDGPPRSRLTMAERLFGVVEHDGERALRGRVRFGHALPVAEPTDGWFEAEATLRILAAPKPPSPALYFGNNGYSSKDQLDLRRHSPQGRKLYLHHRREDVEGRRYETADPADKAKLKARVTPLRRGSAFVFHVDFHNLSREELSLLLYALRPGGDFRHKLGMGKPLGLGTVRIDPVAVFYLDRPACYSPERLFDGKYQAWTGERDTVLDVLGTERAARRYAYECNAVESAPLGRRDQFPAPSPLRDEWRKLLDENAPAVRNALDLLGRTDVPAEVRYPSVTGQDGESELFKWFVANDKGTGRKHEGIEPPAKQRLPPIDRKTTRLPTLPRLPYRS